ncbi:diguanylate cyclase/phosphodiesterase with PAS/PAC sensor(s) [Halomonas daqiaonensis]|uniref:cyclic-guanylate-specific phosphodiesterase n=2 Tax=Halomonas daqiaonensis TaxID=650850 RepID=A0A1H7QZD0_9GAMM|nr:diguanylate cyclase/phosphodiesterase with PAS/PAC sensor(s) [Halomonas daqiaonensis]
MAFHTRLQAALAAFGRAGQGASLEELYRQTVELAIDALGFEAALLIEVQSSNEEGNVVAGITSTGQPDVHWPDALPLSRDNLARLAMERGEPAIGELPPLLDETMKGWTQPLQTLCIPVNEPDRCWGLLYVFQSDQVILSEACLQGLSSLADTLASATRRERDQREMRQADHLRLIAGRAANLGGWSYDPHSTEVHWSDEVCAIHELPSGCRLTGEEALSFYLPEYRERIVSLVEACARAGMSFDEEAEILTAMGNRRQVRVIGNAVSGTSNDVREVQGAFQDITDQRHIEKRLARSHEQFRQLSDAMPGIVWTADKNGQLDYANRRFHAITGITNDVFPGDGWVHALHPDDVVRCMEEWRNSITKQEPYDIDFRLYHKSEDDYRWYRVNADPVRDEQGQVYKWYGSTLDIHDRKVLEEELTQAADTLSRTLESITDGFFTLDRNWNFTYFNLEAEHLLRKSRDKVLNRSIWQVFPELSGSELEKRYRRAMAECISLTSEQYYAPLDTWFENHIYPTEEGLTVYFRDVTERKRSADKIEFLAYQDPMTHLPNRRLFQERLERIIATSQEAPANAGVMLIDLDHFKVLNDTLGHSRGDQLLKAVARRLESLEEEGFHTARLGGDEFAILLEHLPPSLEEAAFRLKRVAEKVLALLGKPYESENLGLQRTCSIGITLVDPEGDSMEEVMKRVDLALYDVKHRGRNAVSLFDPDLQAEANARAWLERNIPAGIKTNEFIPYYQPKMDSEGRCVGAEALLRWIHHERGVISPGEFIPIAEETGLINALGQSVLRQVCAQMAHWTKLDALDGMAISVNISARQFHERGFVDEVITIVEETGIDPARLQLEVTETLLLDDMNQTVEKMSALRNLGISFALDDFGTGYSSLAYLKQLPLDVLKIDQGFVQDLPDDSNDVAIVQTIIALAHSLGLDVLAEGVETAEVQDFLIQEGCRVFQGYLYSRPVPAEDFERYLQNLDDPANSKSE